MNAEICSYRTKRSNNNIFDHAFLVKTFRPRQKQNFNDNIWHILYQYICAAIIINELKLSPLFTAVKKIKKTIKK